MFWLKFVRLVVEITFMGYNFQHFLNVKHQLRALSVSLVV